MRVGLTENRIGLIREMLVSGTMADRYKHDVLPFDRTLHPVEVD